MTIVSVALSHSVCLRVLMTRPGQGRVEKPGLVDLTGHCIRYERAGTKIDLHCFTGLELQTQRYLGHLHCIDPVKEPVHRRIAADVAVIAYERCMDCRALNADRTSGSNLCAPRFQD